MTENQEDQVETAEDILQEIENSAPQQVHPAFTVVIGVESYFDWQPLEGNDPAPGEIVTEVADGRLGVRKLISEPSYTEVSFSPGAFDFIRADRKAAGLPDVSFNRLVAQHLEDVVMPHHAPNEAWVSIQCETLPDLEKYLQTAFELPSPKEKE